MYNSGTGLKPNRGPEGGSVKRTRRFLWVETGRFALALIPFVLAPLACATHITDGIFSPSEWTGSTVSNTFFGPASDGSGNAWLYVDQGPSTLYLGYDYVGGTTLS